MITKYIVLIISVSMTVLASTLLKLGGRYVVFDNGILNIIKGFISSPLIVAGFGAYTLAALLWVYCLANFDLSYATFVSSIQYLLLLVVSIFIFQEQITFVKWLGSAFIMIGVLLWIRG